MKTHTISIQTTVSVTIEVTADMTPDEAAEVALEALRSEGTDNTAVYSADYCGQDLDAVEVRVVEVDTWDGAADAHPVED